MRYEIGLSDDALADLARLSAYHDRLIRDALGRFLRFEPTRESRARIKRLRGEGSPQFRLRVGEFRIFYDVYTDLVQVHAIMTKRDSASWLARFRRMNGEDGAAF